MARVEELAIAIADRAARSDIEVCARHVYADDGGSIYRTDEISDECWGEVDWRLIVAQAVEYIERRGDALPYTMHRSGSVVWFVDRPAAADSNR